MKSRQELKELFEQLPLSAQTDLLSELLQKQELDEVVLAEAQQKVSAQRVKKPCPHYTSTRVYKRGMQKGVRIYQCRDCMKWSGETTGTPLYRFKLKTKWNRTCVVWSRVSIKKIAKKPGISIQTSFDWRHKIPGSLKQLLQNA